MNFYEIMFLVFKGYMYHIHQRVNLHNFSRDDATFTENKGTGPAGEGGGVENYGGSVEHASWKPNPRSDQNTWFALPYVSFQETSDRKKHTILKSLVSERTS